MSILFQSNRNYSKFCACSGCTLYFTQMRSRTALLVYLKSCAKLAVSLELPMTGHAGENLVKAMGSKLAGQGTYNDPVP